MRCYRPTRAVLNSLPRLGGGALLFAALWAASASVARASDASEPRAYCDVREAQEALNAAGYSAGPVDGVPGANTRQAIQSFQTDGKLRANGRLNPVTCSQIAALRRTLGLDARRPGARLIAWRELPGCEYLAARRLENHLIVNRHSTRAARGAPGSPARLRRAVGGTSALPESAMGLGTYVQIVGRGVELCGVRFDAGGFTVVEGGLRLDPHTTFYR